MLKTNSFRIPFVLCPPDIKESHNFDTAFKSSYDYTGRLISSQQTVNGSCRVNNYSFDKDSNRTNLQTLTNDDGSCPADAASAASVTNSPSHTFDAGDRIFLNGAGITANYVYDDLGNTTTLPSIDTTNFAGDVTLAYQPDSQVKSISQAGTVKTFTQDPLGRNVATVETATGAPTVTTVNYFDDSSDSPAWSVDSSLKWTRNISNLAGGLSVISSGTASSAAATSTKTLTTSTMQLTDMHGDVVTTMETTAGANTPTSTSAFDEYGAVLSSPTPTPTTYGWLGSQQRATTNVGLSLMGVRLYNPTTGRFLQTDPVPGGSPNAYAYPTDPIMGYDLDGKNWISRWLRVVKSTFAKSWKFVFKHRKEIVFAAGILVNIVCFGVSAGSCLLLSGLALGASVGVNGASKESGVDLILMLMSAKTGYLLDNNKVKELSKSEKFIVDFMGALPGLLFSYGPKAKQVK